MFQVRDIFHKHADTGIINIIMKIFDFYYVTYLIYVPAICVTMLLLLTNASTP